MSLIHFDSRSCNIFRQLYIIRHALAVIIIWFTISTIFTYNVHGTRKNPVQLRCFWDQRNFQLKGGRCSSEIWCCCSVFLLSILWLRFAMGKKLRKNLSDISKSSQKRFVSIIFLVIPFYSLLLDIHQDAKQGCSHCCAVRAKAIALAFQLLMVRGHQGSSLMVELLPDSLSMLFE